MPRIRGETDAASSFLRAFRKNPHGPPPDKWPAPAILRRWLRRPSFRAAFNSLQETLRLQADFHLSTAANRAAIKLDSIATDPFDAELRTQHSALSTLLRLSHLRQRFSPHDKPQTTNDELEPDNSHEEDADQWHPSPELRTRLQILDNLHLVEPEMRLSKEELRHVAWKNDYPLPLEDFPDFPPPLPQDTFYYYLVMNPYACLYYVKLYGQKTGDYRHSVITAGNTHLIPKEPPELPRFQTQPDPNAPNWLKATAVDRRPHEDEPNPA